MQNSDFKISVIIPTFNRANDLINALKSALNQDFPVLEIIVCDDGSTDNSKQLVNELNDSKIKWIDCGKNGGPAIPRNKGIQSAIGNWVAFLDSDDVWLPNKLEKQIEAIVSLNTLACCSNANRIVENKNAGKYLDFSNVKITITDIIPCNYVICSSALINKDLLVNTSLFPIDKSFVAIEDYALWLRLASKSDFAFVNEPLLNYKDDSSTSIRKNYTDHWIISEIVLTDLKSWLSKANVSLKKETLLVLNYNLIKSKHKGKLSFFDRIMLRVGSYLN